MTHSELTSSAPRRALRRAQQRALRRRVGRFGVWTDVVLPGSGFDATGFVRHVETQGWGAVWFPDPGEDGGNALDLSGELLRGSTHIVVGNAIARVADRSAAAFAEAAGGLSNEFGDRYVAGVGLGARVERPLAVMDSFVAELHHHLARHLHPGASTPVVMAAYGPKMAQLAARSSLGCHTYLVPVEHTRSTRHLVGPDAVLIVEQAVCFESSPLAARQLIRERHLAGYLRSHYNVAKFRRLGYGDSDFTSGGSDRMVDDLVAWGSVAHIANRLRAQLEAGADHVAVHVIAPPSDDGVAALGALAESAPLGN